MDGYNLQLENLQYEISHLHREITKCLEFRYCKQLYLLYLFIYKLYHRLRQKEPILLSCFKMLMLKFQVCYVCDLFCLESWSCFIMLDLIDPLFIGPDMMISLLFLLKSFISWLHLKYQIQYAILKKLGYFLFFVNVFGFTLVLSWPTIF